MNITFRAVVVWVRLCQRSAQFAGTMSQDAAGSGRVEGC